MANSAGDRKALRIVQRLGVVRPIDLQTRGVSRTRLYRMARQGLVERQGRGIYIAAGHSYTEKHGLAQVAKRVPSAVMCLLTALQFHEITTQSPFEVWIALPEKARKPRLEYPPLRVMRFSGAALTEGIEAHRIEGVEVRIYSLAKTIADCFKYRNKIGLDVALEALRDGWLARRFTMNEIDHFARACRVERVMRPYLESLVA